MEINLEIFVTDEMKNYGEYKVIELRGIYLCVFKCGEIFRWVDKVRGLPMKTPKWKFSPNINNHQGYNSPIINCKDILRHRIICYTFKTLDIENTKSFIDHINGNTIDNNSNNLRIVNNQQNMFNRTKSKGYFFNKNNNKRRALIGLNGRRIHLGYFY